MCLLLDFEYALRERSRRFQELHGISDAGFDPLVGDEAVALRPPEGGRGSPSQEPFPMPSLGVELSF